MKKYKLIKEYPGSPKLGTRVVYETEDCYPDWIYQESSKEFWEEIIEKDYEILTYKQNGGNQLYDLQLNGKYKTRFNHNIEYDKTTFNKSNEIISIKRLSDGEIFTIGDNINGFYVKDKTIISFYKDNKTLWVEHLTGRTELQDISKNKKPLFTTQDGVGIFEGDNVYRVFNNYSYIHHKFEKSFLEWIFKNKTELWFSSKKAAENYILNNKPVFSIKEILNELQQLRKENNDYYVDIKYNLKKLFKSKV